MSGRAAATARIERLRTKMAERELVALLVSHLPNIRYLTGFSGSNGWLLLTAERGFFFTDGRYAERAEEELASESGLELEVRRERLLESLAAVATDVCRGQRVGVESEHISHQNYRRLCEEAEAVEWAATSGLVEELRVCKDPREIAAHEAAIRITEEALEQTLKLIEPGVAELEVAAELEYCMRRLGADGPAFETIVATGERSAQPHASTSARKIRETDLVLIDVGAQHQGYCADLTRTFVMGEPDARQREVHEIVCEAREQVRAVLRAGVEAAEVDAAARGVMTARGVERQFPHSTGHGLGLEVHERPRLSRTSEELVRKGMVVTVEPGLYFPDWGGIRIEDDFLVMADTARPLSRLDLGLRDLAVR